MAKACENFVSSNLSKRLGISFENKKYNLESWGEADNFSELREDAILLLEVEKGQKHPSTNVLKVWPYLEPNDDITIALAHAFFHDSPGLSSSRGRLAEWIGEKMEDEFGNRFSYHRLIFNTKKNNIEGLNGLKSRINSLIK